MSTPLRALTALAVLASGAPAAWAQTEDLARRSPWGLLAQALLSLAVVVGVIYLLYFGLRRIGGGRLAPDTEGPMRVLQQRHLGGDRWLYLVEIEGRRLVLGGAEGQIAAIVELDAQPRNAGGERLDEI
ncbi:MAG: FliO/MopB family protein [Armatimonadota bacterium]|jgi:flagellar biogenesis protein FliO